MGKIWRPRDRKLNRDVALKILPDARAAESHNVGTHFILATMTTWWEPDHPVTRNRPSHASDQVTSRRWTGREGGGPP